MSEENSLCFPCLEKVRTKFPVFPVPWPPCQSVNSAKSAMKSLPPTMKLGQGNIFRSVCQEFCPLGGGPSMHCRWYPSLPCRSPGRGGFGIPTCLAGLQAHTQEGGGFQAHTRGRVSQHALRQTPSPVDGYCCGRYASYWNAFLFSLFSLLGRIHHSQGYNNRIHSFQNTSIFIFGPLRPTVPPR